MGVTNFGLRERICQSSLIDRLAPAPTCSPSSFGRRLDPTEPSKRVSQRVSHRPLSLCLHHNQRPADRRALLPQTSPRPSFLVGVILAALLSMLPSLLRPLLSSVPRRSLTNSAVRPFSNSSLGKMRIVPVPVRSDNYAYLLVDPSTHTAAAVDPYDVKKVVDAAEKEGVKLGEWLLTTHHHQDRKPPLLFFPNSYR